MSEENLPDNLKYLLEEFGRSGLRELHIRKGDFELYISHNSQSSRPRMAVAPPPAVVAPFTAPATVAAAQAAPAFTPVNASSEAIPHGSKIVCAPNLGTFYRSPKPGSAPYVEVGQVIGTGDEVCLIEVMKLFTALKSEVGGTIVAVLVEDGAMIEGGQPLFAVMEE